MALENLSVIRKITAFSTPRFTQFQHLVARLCLPKGIGATERAAAILSQHKELLGQLNTPDRIANFGLGAARLLIGSAEYSLIFVRKEQGKITNLALGGELYEAKIGEEAPAATPVINPPSQVISSVSRLLDPRFYDETIIPKPVQDQFTALLGKIPEQLRVKYEKGAACALTDGNEVTRITKIQGLMFEMSRITTILEQGLETVELVKQTTPAIAYTAYRPDTTDFSGSPTESKKSPIDFDITVMRDGKPYVYEVKSYPRMQFGASAAQKNQLLKYQEAIGQGVVAGATVELRGRISREFLQWACGTAIDQTGAIPDIELIYTMGLPSGKEYRFVLKRARNGQGLNFRNEENYDPRDRKIISGIHQAILDGRSIMKIITEVKIKEPSAGLAPLLSNPMEIRSPELFMEYETKRLQSIWETLEAKIVTINTKNDKSAYSGFATREFVTRLLAEYQEMLKNNPEIARVKKAYVIKGEEKFQAVVDEVMRRVELIKQYELARQQTAEEQARAQTRHANGFRGQPEGVALDVEHILMDSIQEVNKTDSKVARSYGHPERFRQVEMLAAYLEGQDRRYLEIAVFDPVTQQTTRQVNTTPANIAKLEMELLKKNLERAQKRLTEIELRTQALESKPDRTGEETVELKDLQARLRAFRMNRRLLGELEALKLEKAEKVKAEKDNSVKKTLAAEYDIRIKALLETVTGRFIQVFGGQRAWETFALRIAERKDQNIVKFIYAVTADGEVVCDEEIIRGQVTGRAAHSELAQGRNVYGAGELVFEKNGSGQWTLIEINNGSGHYRPSQGVLHYVQAVIASKGIDASQVVLRDTLLRGTPIRDISLI